MNEAVTLAQTDALVQPRLDSREVITNKYIRNIWYVALWAEDLQPGQLVSRTILNQPVLFFRRADGTPAAILDRCSHRFAPLSLGKLMPGDSVQCLYHGVEFGADGRCTKNPHGNGAIPNSAHLRSFPLVERHSLIWVWMGTKAPDLTKIPNYSCLDTKERSHVTKPGYLKVQSNYELVVDNLLDLSHTSYVHAGILGNADTVEAEIDVRRDGDVIAVSRPSKNADTPGILKMMSPPGFERGDQWSTISWYAPGNLILEFGVSKPGEPKERGTGYFALHFLTPETDRTTHYHYSAVRWNVLTEGSAANEEIRDKIFAMRTFAFAEQDVPVIEAQQRLIDTADEPLAPVLLAIDAGPVQYRRVLEKLLREDQSA
jgi:phenylpropionate dioxygenase-like ring-hydroxylating dioxygenase large terminal subunit